MGSRLQMQDKRTYQPIFKFGKRAKRKHELSFKMTSPTLADI
ncbi:hypothetical protein SAMN05444682_103230 [Parapedobacter indicus]|uniref:Uncharacterized protein n=1 Tax=Parapedobacter indicus TaxID=1477437 RepID=A0A1I3H5S6_9SPHI|nr:hypothetical protein CLV26_103231 [Parapedobacter indicus]SFI30989.1 hypothetical protein SAMN05444682_103230 [Parapedobacter indicus]